MKQRISDKDKLLIINKHKSGISVTEICKQHGISRSTFYIWLKKLEGEKVVQNSYKLNQQLNKNKEIVEVLKSVNCTQNSPLKEKLYELQKLHSKYSVYVLCEALGVDRGTYYNHILRNKKDKTKYAKHKEEISKYVLELFHSTNEIMGCRKIATILKSRGIATNPTYVNEIMKELGLSSVRTYSKTDYNKLSPKADKLSCNFNTNKPNQIWVSDTSYIPLKNKYYYLCVILDLYSRKVIAYKLSEKHTTNLVSATFKNAFKNRDNPTNLTFHSDQGIQFTANSFQILLKKLKVTQSYSPKGKPTHNAVMESFFSNLKREEIYRNNYKSIAHLKKRLDAYMDFYNNLRPHVTLKYMTPNDFECLKLTVQK
ncbi:MAG: IS3 family transposase [Clostridia bacterium]